jgi:hypothetical protein
MMRAKGNLLFVTALLSFFFRLARLQQAPQDLPASTLLLLLSLLANVGVGVVGSSRYFGDLGTALMANLVDVVVMAGMLWLLLSVHDKQARFTQTLTALYGLGVIFGLVMLLPHQLAVLTDAQQLAGLLMLAVMVWAHVAMGHVLRHALDKRLAAGIALAVGISAASFVVVGNLFPPPMPAGNP